MIAVGAFLILSEFDSRKHIFPRVLGCIRIGLMNGKINKIKSVNLDPKI